MASGKGAKTESEVDPTQASIARRLAEEVVNCDSSILSLIVVDSLGRVLHIARSERLLSEERVDPETVRMFGTIAKAIVGAANNAAPVMGATESIVGVFKRQKVLLVNLQEYNMLLALRLARSANAEYVCDKIEDMLAARGEA